MKGKIVIAGGTGFIGQYLSRRFSEEEYEVKIISRQKNHISWEDNSNIVQALESSEMLINLAGKAIKTKFTADNKIRLIESRVNTTKILGEAVLQCHQAPKIWFNASGAHIYGTSDTKLHTENDPFDTNFFPAIMAKEWEDAFFKFDLLATRKVALRISIVIGKNGGVLQPYIQLARFFLGGKQGTGKQKFSWLHLEDFFQILLFVASKPNISGAINLCSPNPVDNTFLMQSIRSSMHKAFGIPSPAFGIKLGAALLNIESDLILKSLYVYPQVLVNEGYHFKYPTIQSALKEIIENQA
jgi:hypothetical protein